MQSLYKSLFFSFCLCIITNYAFSQVTTEPAFPRADQKVKIIYDATKGTTGLRDVDPVYIHIGAVTAGPTSTTWSIVPFSWGVANPDARMTKVAPNIWEFELTPNTLFNPPGGTTIYRLGMVFRNATGSLEGKTDTNGDFFVDLSEGFQIIITNPTGPTLLEIGENVPIRGVVSEASDITLTANGTEVLSSLGATSFEYFFLSGVEGVYEIEATARKGGETSSAKVTITVVGPSPQAPLPAGAKKGINYISDTEAILVLEAPGKKNAFVIGDFNNWEINTGYQMFHTMDRSMFWYRLTGLTPGEEYIFQYLVDGNLRIGDPYADKVSDPFHDDEIIAQGRYPGLRPYPKGKTDFQATFLQTAQQPYQWKYLDYEKPEMEKLVIYELLVRDFDDRRTFKAVTERLDYLLGLGINAIELMPIKEFEGNLSWGYNPSFFFAVDKFYGTKNDLKELIDEAHKRGIVIILDMVLNHAFGQSPFVRLYNDGDYGAPTLDNPWLNRTAKHPFNVGYDFNHESEFTKAFVDSVNNYWLTEYKVDGFRFDLSKGFTQVNSGDNVGLWGQRDESRIAIWKRIYDNIKKNHPEAYVILEHFSENNEERELSNYGLMFWGNMNFDFRDMAKGNSRNFDWGYYQTRGWANNTLVSYMESHDEERTMWETLTHGQTSPINLRQLNNGVNRNQLLAAFALSIPGPKMLWQFEEFGYDIELSNDRLGIKPTRWEYLNNPERQRLLRLYKALTTLKKDYNFLNKPQNVTLDLIQQLKSIKITDGDTYYVVYGNFGLTDLVNVTLTFPQAGTWYDYITGQTVNLSTSSLLLQRFRPNQFMILTNKKFPTPEGPIYEDPILSLGPESVDLSDFNIYPIPAEDHIQVLVPQAFTDFKFRIVDVSGVVLYEGLRNNTDNILTLDIANYTKGLYIFEISDSRHVIRRRFLKK